MTEPQEPKFDAEGEDAKLLANWLAGPGARSTDEERERWLRLSREGRIPRRQITLEEMVALHHDLPRGRDLPLEERRDRLRQLLGELEAHRGEVQQDAEYESPLGFSAGRVLGLGEAIDTLSELLPHHRRIAPTADGESPA